MITTESNELKRLKNLVSYSILDTLPESDYDSITKMASMICKSKISLISFVDQNRLFFKSRYGLDVSEAHEEFSFCASAIQSGDDIYIIENACEDPTYKSNPMVLNDPKICFYAGVPLISEEGFPLGTINVIDSYPRTIDSQQIEMLKMLGKQVENLLTLRKNRLKLKKSLDLLEVKNEDLENFAYIAAHDMKTPLINISSLITIVLNKDSEGLSASQIKKMQVVGATAEKLARLTDALLNYSKMSLNGMSYVKIDVKEVFKTIQLMYKSERVHFNVQTDFDSLYFSELGFYQIVSNLLINGIKYNDKHRIEINIELRDLKESWQLRVSDNGIGIDEKDFKHVFQNFSTLKTKDRYGNYGCGLGLSIMTKMIKDHKGKVDLESEVGKGSTFIVEIPYLQEEGDY